MGSIDTVLVIKRVIEHHADKFVLLGWFLGQEIDAVHIGEFFDVSD